MRINHKSLRPMVTLAAVFLFLGLGLTACSTGDTPTSVLATAVSGAAQTAGTVASNGAATAGTVVSGAVDTASASLTKVPTVVSGAAQTAGTVVSGAIQTAGTVASNGAATAGTVVSNAVETAGTVVSGAAQTAGTAIAGELTPGVTPATGAALTPAATPTVATTPTAYSLPEYPGALAVNVSPNEYTNYVKDFPVINGILSSSVVKVYAVKGGTLQNLVVQFYQTTLTKDGWTKRTGQLGPLTNSSNLQFLDAVPSVYTRGNDVLLLGISSPLTADSIQQANLGSQFQAGDIVVVGVFGKSIVPIS